LHNDVVFALAWGSFPVLTAYYAQAERVDHIALTAAVAAFFLSWAQRALSSRARELRRRVARVEGTITRANGDVEPLDVHALLRPLEIALAATAAGLVTLAIAVLLLRLT
jgi:hypothetical protein